MSSRFERVASETKYEGKIFSVVEETFRHEDGEDSTREIVRHQGAVGVVAHDGERIYLVRQPREAIGVPDLLEIPAGKLDVDGESPLQTARRELAEEIGQEAEHWEAVISYFPSSGYTDEVVHVFAATDLHPSDVKPDPHERIEVVRWPLDDLDGAIQESRDAKTIVGLQWLKLRLMPGHKRDL